jgi:hypothetical protein
MGPVGAGMAWENRSTAVDDVLPARVHRIQGYATSLFLSGGGVEHDRPERKRHRP